jgi:hypothetical protein
VQIFLSCGALKCGKGAGRWYARQKVVKIVAVEVIAGSLTIVTSVIEGSDTSLYR